MNLLLQLLAILRALQWSHQTAHWKVRGESSYQDHLLFQKLYEAVGEEIDTLAEKIVGIYGPDAIHNLSVLSDTHQFIANHAATGAGDSSYQCALQMEEHLQRALKLAYDGLKASGEMSLGLDDFLMATANAHETALYLLRQRLRPRIASRTAAVSYSKQKINLALSGGKSEEVLADVYGPWAIHKSLGGSGWTITFAPLGLAIARPKTQMDSRALLEAILEKAPTLADARTEADVKAHYGDIKDILRNPPKASGTAKRAPSVSLAEKREQVIGWLMAAGMRPKGSRYGKAGDFFYPPVGYGETPTLAISVGARDLLLNSYLMSGRDERWVMEDSELLSKVDEDLVKRWVGLTKAAPTRSEVRKSF